MSKTKVGGILQWPRLAAISILGIADQPGIAAAVMRALGQEHINVQFVVQCIDEQRQDHIVVCIDRVDLGRAEPATQTAAHSVGAQSVEVLPDVCTVAIFGPDFRLRPGIAADMFAALAGNDINIIAISTSISTVSCVIQEQHAAAAMEALQAAFELP